MSRSYNNRKGVCTRKYCGCRWSDAVEDWKRSKNNRKRNIIKFDGILYKENALKSQPRNNCHSNKHYYPCDWFGNEEKIKNTRESYKNHKWMKGCRPNPKGWIDRNGCHHRHASFYGITPDRYVQKQ